MGTSLSKESLFVAIESGKYEGIKKILAENPQLINSPMTNDCKTTPLVRAAWRGDTHLLEILIELGADVNFPGKDGITALMWAAIRGRMDVIKFLLQKKADAQKISEQGFHALDYAIIYVHMEAAHYLFSNTNLIPKTISEYNDYCLRKRIPRKNYNDFLDKLIKADKQLNEKDSGIKKESFSSDNLQVIPSKTVSAMEKSASPKVKREESIISNLKNLLEYEDPSQVDYDNTEEYRIEFESDCGSMLKITKSSSKGKQGNIDLDDLFLFE